MRITSIFVIVLLINSADSQLLSQTSDNLKINQNITHKDSCNQAGKILVKEPESNLKWIDITIPIIVAILGGLLAIYQVKMNIIKSARINWIENLRDNMSKFISATSNVEQVLDLMITDIKSGKDSDVAFKERSDSLIKSSNESMRYATKVKLYLNIVEKNHNELSNKIDEFVSNCSDAFDKRGEERIKAKNKINTILQSIVSISQKIIKSEWDRVSKNILKRIVILVFKRE